VTTDGTLIVDKAPLYFNVPAREQRNSKQFVVVVEGAWLNQPHSELHESHNKSNKLESPQVHSKISSIESPP
jgi:hypothetical protein